MALTLHEFYYYVSFTKLITIRSPQYSVSPCTFYYLACVGVFMHVHRSIYVIVLSTTSYHFPVVYAACVISFLYVLITAITYIGKVHNWVNDTTYVYVLDILHHAVLHTYTCVVYSLHACLCFHYTWERYCVYCVAGYYIKKDYTYFSVTRKRYW